MYQGFSSNIKYEVGLIGGVLTMYQGSSSNIKYEVWLIGGVGVISVLCRDISRSSIARHRFGNLISMELGSVMFM
jgi:hypothetical protein